MKIDVGFNEFEREFERAGRKEQFSYDALVELYKHLIEIEESTGEELTLDVIGLCCDYTSDSIENVMKEYECGSFEELKNKINIIWFNENEILYYP